MFGIKEVLLWLSSKELSNVVVELDSLLAIKAISRDQLLLNELGGVI